VTETLSLKLLIEPEELLPHLDAENVLLVHIAQEEAYLAGHLPGAVHVHPAELICGIRPAVGQLPDQARLEALFSRLGYREDLHIVAYDDEGGGWAGRFIWTLDVIGHERASMLNGGLIAWARGSHPISRETVSREPQEVSLTVDSSPIAEKEDVLASLEQGNTVVWDARSRDEYLGLKSGSARAGHIPGAVNLDWLLTMDRERDLRLREDMRELLAQLGIDDTKRIITHCQTHHRSGLTYFIGRWLGLDIRAYHGSWSEWGNDPDTPIEV